MKTSEKKHITEIGKKIAAILLALGLVCGIGATAVACEDNSEQGGQENTDNRQPENPSGEDKEDAEDTDNSDGDIEEPENPGGEIEEPENPGEVIGEPEDPDDNIEEPENPDGNTETPGGNTEDQKIPFVIDTISELTEYKGETFYNYFNDNYLSSVLTKLVGRSAVVENSENFEWAITGTEGETITELQVRFVYHADNGSYRYFVGTFIPNEAISIADILNGNTKSHDVLPAYTTSVVEADMEQNQPLAEAIVTKLGGTLADSDLLLLTMNNASTDPQYSWVISCVVKQITETGVNEYTITINARNAYVENLINQLILNLQADEYKNGKVENNVISLAPAFDENSLDKQTPEFESDHSDNG